MQLRRRRASRTFVRSLSKAHPGVTAGCFNRVRASLAEKPEPGLQTLLRRTNARDIRRMAGDDEKGVERGRMSIMLPNICSLLVDGGNGVRLADAEHDYLQPGWEVFRACFFFIIGLVHQLINKAASKGSNSTRCQATYAMAKCKFSGSREVTRRACAHKPIGDLSQRP